MTVLFGTIEYFEREITNFLKENHLQGINDRLVSEITAKLEDEVLNDFVCDERLRLECLNNLKNATNMLMQLK